MKTSYYFILPAAALLLAASGCNQAAAPAARTTFIDVHEFGPGKVTAAAVAKAHAADLATEGKHDVKFLDYWVDEERGRVYCLSQANDAESVIATHREAHGLLPAHIEAVSGGAAAAHTPGAQLYIDEHDFGPGKVTAKAVAEAHEKDLAVESQFGVRFLNYWVDEANGKVFCLSEAPSADAVRETHRHAHGLMPATVEKVTDSK
ncbi:MAG TPA: DUF4242 domain-containing protein [Opitutus sp.]|nr:DUF4242 domain-containing protein [Opitutus sp.]